MNANNNQFEQVKRNFFDTAVADVYRAIDGGSLMGAFVLTSCLIDYGGAIMTRNSNHRMSKWINKYLKPQNPLYGITELQEDLIHIRHGLIHSYGSFNNQATQHMPVRFVSDPRIGAHLVHDPAVGGRAISLYYLLPHVTIGLWNTFEDSKERELNKYAQGLIQVIGRSEEISEKSYASMHLCLSHFDEDIDSYRFERIQVHLQDSLRPKDT